MGVNCRRDKHGTALALSWQCVRRKQDFPCGISNDAGRQVDRQVGRQVGRKAILPP